MPTIRFLPLITGRRRTFFISMIASGIVEFLLIEAEHDARGHHIARGCGLGIQPLGDAAADDVPVRHHADQTIVLADRDGADVVLAHQSCELLTDVPGPTHCTPLCMACLHFHGRLPFLVPPRREML